MLKKYNLITMHIEDPVYGAKLSITSSTANNLDTILIKAEEGLYNLVELKEAIKQAEEFASQQKSIQEQAEREAAGITEVHA